MGLSPDFLYKKIYLGKSQPCIHKVLDYDLDNWSILLLLTGVDAVVNVPEGHGIVDGDQMGSVHILRSHFLQVPYGIHRQKLHQSLFAVGGLTNPHDS